MYEIQTDMVDVPMDGEILPGYLARPEQDRHFPAVVVIQEWWGLVEHIKEVADRFARHGFIALAPDLYHGEAAKEPDEARKLAMQLEEDRALGDIQAGIDFLRRMKNVSPKNVGVVGFCMGGRLALAAAARSAGLGAAVVFYGRPGGVAAEDVSVPFLGLYGEEDHGIPPEDVRRFGDALEGADVPNEIHLYPGAGHAFFNDSRPQAYHREAAEDAWERTIAWFEQHLLRQK